MNCRKASILCLFFTCVFFVTIYVIYFNHGPPEKILSANSKTNEYLQRVLEGDGDEEVLKSARAWNSFIEAHHYVSIGDIYDSCGKWSKLWIIFQSGIAFILVVCLSEVIYELDTDI